MLDDQTSYGRGLAAAYRTAAERLGLEVIGAAHWKPEASGYDALAERVRASRPDTVFVAGEITSNGPKLIADLTAGLGRGVHVFAGDSFNQPSTTLTTEGIYRIKGGRLVFETAITPPAELLAGG